MYNYQMQNISNDNYVCTPNAKCEKCTTTKCKISQITTIYVHQITNVKNVHIPNAKKSQMTSIYVHQMLNI